MSELLTVPEAATVAGVPARTMRRWVTNGQVRTVGHGHGRRSVAASLSEPAANEAANGHGGTDGGQAIPVTAATETANGHEADRLADLGRDLTVRLSEQTGLTAKWQERAGQLGDRLAAAESQLLALDAPKSIAPTTASLRETAALDASTGVETGEPATAPCGAVPGP
jgi:hypothetical protein